MRIIRIVSESWDSQKGELIRAIRTLHLASGAKAILRLGDGSFKEVEIIGHKRFRTLDLSDKDQNVSTIDVTKHSMNPNLDSLILIEKKTLEGTQHSVDYRAFAKLGEDDGSLPENVHKTLYNHPNMRDLIRGRAFRGNTGEHSDPQRDEQVPSSETRAPDRADKEALGKEGHHGAFSNFGSRDDKKRRDSRSDYNDDKRQRHSDECYSRMTPGHPYTGTITKVKQAENFLFVSLDNPLSTKAGRSQFVYRKAFEGLNWSEIPEGKRVSIVSSRFGARHGEYRVSSLSISE